jgi:lysophospholipase L1-like esterase
MSRVVIYCFLFASVLIHLAAACDKSPEVRPEKEAGIRYLALGDSYTIGESVEETERYPVQLAAALDILPPTIIAKTGWTTIDLQSALQTADLDTPYQLVSLLIGVNNQYQGRPLDAYEETFEELLDQAVQYAGGDKTRVFVLSIPDYAYTPFGQNRDHPSQISIEIDSFNLANKTITEGKGIRYFDITPISRNGLDDPLLVAADGLHPSGEMYRQWVRLILPEVQKWIQP